MLIGRTALSVPMTPAMGSPAMPCGAVHSGFMLTAERSSSRRAGRNRALTPFCRITAHRGELRTNIRVASVRVPSSLGERLRSSCATGSCPIFPALSWLPVIILLVARCSGRSSSLSTRSPVSRKRTTRSFFAKRCWSRRCVQACCTARPSTALGHVAEFYTGERHAGGKFITAAAPLDHIPLFARGGHVIPLTTRRFRPGIITPSYLADLIVPGEDWREPLAAAEDYVLAKRYAPLRIPAHAVLVSATRRARHGSRLPRWRGVPPISAASPALVSARFLGRFCAPERRDSCRFRTAASSWKIAASPSIQFTLLSRAFASARNAY